MDIKTLSRLSPFRELNPKTRVSLLDFASNLRFSLPASTPPVPRLCFQTLGSLTTDLLSPILLPLSAASGIRSIRFLLPGAQPIDVLQRKMSLFSGWTSTIASCKSGLSLPGVSILGLDPLFIAVLDSALKERSHIADKELLRAAVSMLLIDCDAFVFDVQAGPGTIFPDISQGGEAAHTLLRLCDRLHTRRTVMIRELNRPTGLAFGDALEIREAVSALRGSAPYALLKLLLEYGSEIMSLTGIRRNKVEARMLMKDILLSRKAASLFENAVEEAGGDFKPWKDPARCMHSDFVFSVPTDRSGYLHGLNIPLISRALNVLFENRPKAGFNLLKSSGDYFKRGENMFSVFGCPDGMASSIRRDLLDCAELCSAPPSYHPLIRLRLK